MIQFLKRHLAACAVSLIALGGLAAAQTSSFLPIPSNVCTAKGAIAVAHDENNLTCIAAVAAGQVLTSAGVGTLPAWAGLTLGTSGTEIEQIRVHSVELTPSAVAANTCAEQSFAVSGIAAGDTLVVNLAEQFSPHTGLVGGKESGTDTVALTFCNPTADDESPTPGTYTIIAIRS